MTTIVQIKLRLEIHEPAKLRRFVREEMHGDIKNDEDFREEVGGTDIATLAREAIINVPNGKEALDVGIEILDTQVESW